VQPVADEGRGSDLAAGADAVSGDEFVAGESDQGRCGDGYQGGHVVRVQEAGDGLVGGES